MTGRPRREGKPGRQWWQRGPVLLGLGAAAAALAVAVVLALVWPPGDGAVTLLDDGAGGVLDEDEQPPAVTVPDVVGLPLAEAVAEVASAGLRAATEVVETPGGTAAGTIVAQDPPAGAEADAGSQVLLGVARSNGQAPGAVVDQEPDPGRQGTVGSRARVDVAEAGEDRPRRNIIAWLLDLGPSAPSGPSQFRAYELLRDGECAELVRRLDSRGDGAINLAPASDGLYRGAAAACLAAFHGQQAGWADAIAALGVVDPADPRVGCLDAAAHRLLEQLVRAHRDNPGGRFERATGGSSAHAPPCPALTRLEPDSGSPDAVVRVTGTNLERVTSVRLVAGGGACPPGPAARGESLDFAREGGGLVVTLEEALPGPACIVLSAAPDGWAADGAPFTVVEEPRAAEGEGAGRGGGVGESEEPGERPGEGEGMGEGEPGAGEGDKPREQSSAPEEPATPGTPATDQPGS